MTPPLYTEADLRTEAVRQHANLTEDPDFVGVGERMDQEAVASTQEADEPLTWAELLECDGDLTPAYEDAQKKVHDLISGAADVSAWAVDLGADGLQPEDHTLTVDGDGEPLVRLHCAFAPALDDRARIQFMTGLAKAMANAL